MRQNEYLWSKGLKCHSCKPTISIHSSGKIWDIDFKTMRAKKGKYEVRRLSTKSSAEDERHPLATKWNWYWQDQMKQWKLYGQVGVFKFCDVSSKTTRQVGVFVMSRPKL